MEASLFDFFREVMLPRESDDRPRRRATSAATATRRPTRRGARAAALRDEVPAVHRAGPGQGARRHGVLPLQRAAVAQRSRRRSVAVRPVGRRIPRRQPATGCATGRSRCSPRPRTTRSSAKTCARGINVLSEMPDEWAREVVALDAHQPRAPHASSTASRRPTATTSTGSTRRCSASGRPTGRRRDWRPADLVERLQAYMIKAVKEAKVHTSWLTQNQDVRGRADDVRRARADRRRRRRFLPRSCRSRQRIAVAGHGQLAGAGGR